jgi:hypothetical protein
VTASLFDPALSHEETQLVPGADLTGRFMLPDTSEHPCKVSRLTIEGAFFTTGAPPPPGLPIVAYIDGIGRVVGTSGPLGEDGFSVNFTMTGTRRDRFAARLDTLNGKEAAPETSLRRSVRYHVNTSSQLGLPDGRMYACEVLDISLTGAAIKTDVMPSLGTCVVIGKMRGRIIRYTDKGVAIEFVKPLDRDSLAEHLR